MKKLVAILLLVVLCIPVGLMTSCSDPLKEKMEELDAAFVEMGAVFQDTIMYLNLAGVDTQDDIKAMTTNWKNLIKDAKTVVEARLNLDEQQMDEYIAQWKALTAEIAVVRDEYYQPDPFAETEKETAAEAAAE